MKQPAVCIIMASILRPKLITEQAALRCEQAVYLCCHSVACMHCISMGQRPYESKRNIVGMHRELLGLDLVIWQLLHLCVCGAAADAFSPAENIISQKA